MKNYYGLEKGDRLVRNAYTVSHFTVGKEYEILTFVDGQPRVMGDKGELVTITSQYNPKYFDLLSLPDTGSLKAGDLIKFQKNYNNLGREKEYIVNRVDGTVTPYVYGLNGKVVRLTNRTYFFKKVGSLKQNLSLAHQVKPGDRLIRLVPGGQYHNKNQTYTVGRVEHGVVWVHTEQGYIRAIKEGSEKNWKKYEPRIQSITVHETAKPVRKLDEIVRDLARVVDHTTALRKEAKQIFLDIGLDDETAQKAMEQALLKGLKSL